MFDHWKHHTKVGHIHYHDSEWEVTYDELYHISDNLVDHDIEEIGVLKRMPNKFLCNGKLFDTRAEAEIERNSVIKGLNQ